MQQRARAFLLTGLMLLCAPPLRSADYYFGPENWNIAIGWTSDLGLIVENNNITPILLQLTIEPMEYTQEPRLDQSKLEVLPLQILLRAREKRDVALNYLSIGPSTGIERYKLQVEQLPVLFVKPGTNKVPPTMKVRNYQADILVRPNSGNITVLAESKTSR